MRVLAMLHAYIPTHNAGAELTAHALLRHLAGEGHDVHVQLSTRAPRPAYERVEGVHVHAHANRDDPMRFFGTEHARPDVVLTHLENTPRASILGQMHNIPVVHLLHNDHEWTKHCLRRTPPALAVHNSEWMADSYARWWTEHDLGALPASIVIAPPVFSGDYQTTPGRRITLINLNEDKGARLFWTLAAELPDRQFLGVRGAYGAQVVGDDPNVKVLEHRGPMDMAADVYHHTKVLLMPSLYESWGRTAIEAAHSGIPTIAHPTPGLRESLGEAGIFVDRDDIAGWIRTIKLLHTPRGYSNASKRSITRAAQLDPTPDLDLFATSIEKVARRAPVAAR